MSFMQQLFKHPLWQVGFRPLFILGMLGGAVLPMLWYLMFSNRLSLELNVSTLHWHVHEMYFGFGWAVLGGFMLTATKNWAGVRGFHGWVLALVCLFWLLDRAAFWLPAGAPGLLPLLMHNAFLLLIVPLILWTLLTNLQKVAVDNWYFILSLPLFILSKNLLLYSEQHFELAWTISNGVFRLAVALMLERTLAAFMQAHYQIQVPQYKPLDNMIRLGMFVAIFEAVLPKMLVFPLLGGTATLLLVRFFMWSPKKGFSVLDTGVSFAAYLALVAGLYLEALRVAGLLHTVGDVATHVFTMLAMGLLMAAMIIRITQGHTARKIVFARSDRLAIWLLVVGGLARIILPQIWPQHYANFVLLAAFCWELGFILLGWRLIPFLLKPRLDGKEG